MMIWANIHSVCPELSDSERCKASGYWIMIFTDSDNAKNPISSLQNAREHAIFNLKTTHLGVSLGSSLAQNVAFSKCWSSLHT